MARYAPTDHRSADLAEAFGRDLATRWFGAEALASLPLRTVGKNKGAPKGVLCWLRTREAGYHPNAGRAVAAGTVVRAWIGPGHYSPESSALRGMWMGRVQELCGSRDLLTQEARDRNAAERERDRAEMEARLAALEAAR